MKDKTEKTNITWDNNLLIRNTIQMEHMRSDQVTLVNNMHILIIKLGDEKLKRNSYSVRFTDLNGWYEF